MAGSTFRETLPERHCPIKDKSDFFFPHSNCTTRGANCPHIDIPICLGTRQEIPSWGRKRCLVLRRSPHLLLCPRGGSHWYGMGSTFGQNRKKARSTHRMLGHNNELAHGRVCIEYLGSFDWQSCWWILERQYWCHSDDGGRIGH